jgi:hypothetical protein
MATAAVLESPEGMSPFTEEAEPKADEFDKISLQDPEKVTLQSDQQHSVEELIPIPQETRIEVTGRILRRSILKSSQPSHGTEDTTKSGGTRKTREVSFHSISIRHYPMILGDNPAVSIGSPVQLDWDFQGEERHDLDIYEVERRPRRKLRHLVLSYYRRKDILLQAGYDEDEMRSKERQLEKMKRQRKTTGFFLPVSKLEEVFQSAGRKVKRAKGKEKKGKESK